MLENHIEEISIETEYNAEKSINVPFVVEGKAKLGNYYNQEYNKEEYFCVKVVEIEENINDYWNIYFKKIENEKLYEFLQEKERFVMVKGIIQKNNLQRGLELMAIGEVVRFAK